MDSIKKVRAKKARLQEFKEIKTRVSRTSCTLLFEDMDLDRDIRHAEPRLDSRETFSSMAAQMFLKFPLAMVFTTSEHSSVLY